MQYNNVGFSMFCVKPESMVKLGRTGQSMDDLDNKFN